jgi:Domain of unknown function (DUF4406)/dATP/dGTP diphosphohydrolase, N-terminal
LTEVTTTLHSAYLAGPMRGIEDYNFPEFHKQAAWLRANGWKIFSPAERDEQDEHLASLPVDKAGWQGPLGLDYFMAYDLHAVCTHDAVILMEGWETSQGARLEAMVAVEIGHPVFEIVLRSTNPDEWPDVRERGLESVDPTRISAEFIAGTRANDFLGTVEPFDPVTVELDPIEQRAQEIHEAGPIRMTLPTDSAGRKAVPIASGVLDYFPAALVEVAKVSKAGNDKHNPGQPLHHARGKSTDHADALLRHLIDRGKVDEETGQLHSAEVAWRALALLQQELEDNGAPLARGARLPEGEKETQ